MQLRDRLYCLLPLLTTTLSQALWMAPNRVRIELFFKTHAELQDRVQWLASKGFSSFSVVNKDKSDKLHDWLEVIKRESSDANICLHYSLKYQRVNRGTVEQHLNRLEAFLKSIPNEQEVLLISGSTKTSGFDTVDVLRHLKSQGCTRRFAVAYNPFFPNANDQAEERRRLDAKLESLLVSKIYLQFGTDLERLESELESLAARNVELAGSIFLPTKQLIAQQKFRPWKGVYLSEEFLSGTEYATKLVSGMIELYDRFNVELLIEAPGVRSEKDLLVLTSLLEGREPSSMATGDKILKMEMKNASEESSPNASLPKRQRRNYVS